LDGINVFNENRESQGAGLKSRRSSSVGKNERRNF